jgi:hypothetical protein
LEKISPTSRSRWIPDQPQPLDHPVGPGALCAKGSKRDRACDGTGHRQRDDHRRLGALLAKIRFVRRRLIGQIGYLRKEENVAAQHFGGGPGQLVKCNQGRGRFTSRNCPRVGRARVGLGLRKLEQGAAIHLQKLREALKAMLDLPVDLTGRQVQEPGREPGEQGFELKPFFNCHFGAFELCDLRS